MSTATRRVGTWAVLAALLCATYAGLATQFTYELWPTTSGGFIFNSQLRALLELRLDIDPDVIGMEGFVRDGKTYTYFGILPALLRLPLVNHLWLDWTTLSCVSAAVFAALALLGALHASCVGLAGSAPATGARVLVAITVLLSGPQVELLGKPSVYVEAVLWSYACACAFLWLVMPLLLGGTASGRRLALLAACAALALLARVSTGLALYISSGLLALVLMRDWRAAGWTWPAQLRHLLPATLLLVGAIVATFTVNQQRWGDPLQFAALTANRYYDADPARLARLERHGVFGLARIPHALTYYAAPGWFFAAPPDSARRATVATLFDGPEGPPVGIVQAQPLWLGLAATGIWTLLAGAGAVRRRRVLAVLAGLLVAGVIISSYHYLAFRYRAEFAPPVLLLAYVGLRRVQQALIRRRGAQTQVILGVLLLLAVTQVIQARAAVEAHACTPFGSYAASRAKLEACLQQHD